MQNKIWPEGVATIFGVGKWDKTPRAFGGLLAFLIVFGLSFLNPFLYMTFCILLIILTILAADQYIIRYVDSKEVTADKFVGLMIALYLLPHDWTLWVLGFVFFHILVVLKPFPLSHLSRSAKGGFGVVLDDLIAGLFVNAFIHYIWIPHIETKVNLL